MRRVIIESPFQGGTEREAENRRYLAACIGDSLRRGEAPFASHAIYPGTLDDTVPDQRRLGLEAGFAWRAAADATIVYVDRGITPGMLEGIANAQASARRTVPHVLEFRSLEGWSSVGRDEHEAWLQREIGERQWTREGIADLVREYAERVRP